MNNLPDLVLKAFDGKNWLTAERPSDWKQQNGHLIRRGLVIDVETSGMIAGADQIIEIALLPFSFDRENGDLIEVEAPYSALQQLREDSPPLSKFVKQLTGLTDEKLKGHSIDTEKCDSMIAESDLVIAHNASFDRPFLDRLCNASKEKVWACSCNQIDWMSKGFRTKALELLTYRHGFYCCSHRALADVQATLHLITHIDRQTGKTYLNELLETARIPSFLVEAIDAPFDRKDLLKNRGYRWQTKPKVWTKTLQSEEETGKEMDWLKENIYVEKGHNPARISEIPIKSRFSN